jgi:uncharacterized membrane protein HdeD (DUF308 family)
MDQAVSTTEARPTTGGWWLVLLIGLISAVVGIVIMAQPGESLTTLAVIVGIFLLFDGVLELAASLLHTTQSRGMVALLGVITAIIGVLLIRHPTETVVAVGLLIGIWLIAVGVVRVVAAFETDGHRGWNVGVGVVELIAGIVIVANPNIGYGTLALLVGISFVINGLGMLALGWSMHSVGRDAATG